MRKTSWQTPFGMGLMMGLILATGSLVQADGPAKPGVARISDFQSTTGNVQVSHTAQDPVPAEVTPTVPPAEGTILEESVPATEVPVEGDPVTEAAPAAGQCNICPKCNKCHNCQKPTVSSCSQPARRHISHGITVPSASCLHHGIPVPSLCHYGLPLPCLPYLHFGKHAEDCECERCRNGHRGPGRFGYFLPRGGKGKGLPLFGAYQVVYPLNPQHFDPRDGQIYAAQGYGVPMAVPLAPNVHATFNYGWGVPSSRLTHINQGLRIPATYPEPNSGERYATQPRFIAP